jgi:polo-like kinase 4
VQAPSNGTFTSTAREAVSQQQTMNCTLDNTLLSTVTGLSSSSENSTALTGATCRETQQHLFVTGIGWASQLANGEIWVKFTDGTQLGMKASATTITYIDTSGKLTK